MKRKVSLILLISMTFVMILSTAAYAETTPPSSSSYWDLDNHRYNATLTQVGTGELFTNYYFHARSDGIINVSWDVTSDGSGTLRIFCYDMNTQSNVAYYDVPEIPHSPASHGNMHFYNLDTSHNYAIGYASLYDGFQTVYISGSSTVFH